MVKFVEENSNHYNFLFSNRKEECMIRKKYVSVSSTGHDLDASFLYQLYRFSYRKDCINDPTKLKCTLTHGDVTFSQRYISVAAGIFWCTWQEWQLCTFSLISLSIPGHHTHDLASAFIYAISGWLSCKSSNTLSPSWNGMIRPVNECCAIELTCTHTHQYLFRCAIFTSAKLYMTS